ncbi:MAG: translation initiation factor IF-2 subunit beta [Candidatus Woesearchaeota archaeon]
MEYEELLKKALNELPAKSEATERFTIPNVKGHVEGNKTIISNFFQIAKLLRRSEEHFLKFILKELATPGEFKGKLLVLGTIVPASKINDKIQYYAEKFVVCKECGKPETKLTKEGSIYFINCQACGARHSIIYAQK